MAALIALILFMLAAFGVEFDAINIVYLAGAFIALALLIGNWPLGAFINRQR